MFLQKVFYRLEAADVEWFRENPDLKFHEWDHELVLVDNRNRKTFVSHAFDGKHYSMAISDASFAKADLIDHEFSGQRMWSQLLQSNCTIDEVDDHRLALKISNNSAKLFVCAYEDADDGIDHGWWGSDTVHVRTTLPPGLGEFLNG